MEDLITLTRLLSVQKVKQIEIITEDAEMSSKTKMLYEAIKNGKIQSDEEAAALLYDSTPNHAAYRKLKYRLKQRLINTLFFIDIQSYSKSEYQKVLNKSFKNWAAFKILLDRGVRQPAINIAESILKSSLSFDLLELSFLICKDLKFQYGIFLNNNYKYKKYSEQFNEISKLLNLRIRAEELYTEYARIILKTKNYEYNDEVQKLELSLKDILNSPILSKSYYTYYYTLEAAYFNSLIKKDLHGQLKYSDQGIKYFKDKNQFNNLAIFSFTEKKGICLLSLERYNEAMEQFNECLTYLPTKGGISWYNLQNYKFITHIIAKNYNEALFILVDVMNSKGFKNLSDSFREPWYLKEAFINFLIQTGRIDKSLAEEYNLRSFRLSRFLNEVSTFSKDKRGLNITINIIQMLFLIVDEKYDQVLDKLSALRQYNFRYLKRPEYTRSSNFVKMLLKIPEGDYKASTIRKKAHKYHLKLLESPNDYSEHSLSLEIIPYEQLWEEILSMFPD